MLSSRVHHHLSDKSIIHLMYKFNRCSFLQHYPQKSRHVTRSTLARETISLAEAFHQSYILKHVFQRILGNRIYISMMTNSKLLSDVITWNWLATEARLIVYIAAVREAYNQRTIPNIALIDRAYNNADPLTKIAYYQLSEKVTPTGYLNHSIRQYVLGPSTHLCLV